MDDDWSFFAEFFGLAECTFERLDVMAIDWSGVTNAEGFKECWRLKKFAHTSFEGIESSLSLGADAGEFVEEALNLSLTAYVHRIHANVGERAR